MRATVLFGMLMMGLASVSSKTMAADHTKDTPNMVKKAVADDKAVLLDVREKDEWDEGHLKIAKLLPMSVLKGGAKVEDVAKLAPKGKIVYLHCGSGVRSLKAAEALRKLGYDARALKPGFAELVEAGFDQAPK